MNAWQMAQQLKAELEAVTWPDGSLVFGPRAVFVYAGAPLEDSLPPGYPFALVTIDQGVPDEDDPDLIEQQFGVVSCVSVAGDPVGQNSIIGGPRRSGNVYAQAGSAEVSERARYACQKLTAYDGAAIVVSASGSVAPQMLGQRHVAFDTFNVRALCTSQATYAAPQKLVYAGGTWTWDGAQCSSRFDFIQYRLGYIAGSTPATDVDNLTIVYTGSAATTTVTQTASRVYHIVADYSARGSTDSNGDPIIEGTSSTVIVGSYVVA